MYILTTWIHLWNLALDLALHIIVHVGMIQNDFCDHLLLNTTHWLTPTVWSTPVIALTRVTLKHSLATESKKRDSHLAWEHIGDPLPDSEWLI